MVGAGQMGAGIAQVAARAGLIVTLSDQAESPSRAGQVAKLEARLRRQQSDGKVAAGQSSTRRWAASAPAARSSGVADADLVIEAAPEQLELKTALFRSFDAACPKPSAILASNTSSLSITRLARETTRPELVVGMHFMNPVPVMKLVEVVRGTLTSEATLATRARAFAQRLGKQSIVSQDRPGFLVNRILIPLLNEACFALEEGVGTKQDIDTGARLGLGHPARAARARRSDRARYGAVDRGDPAPRFRRSEVSALPAPPQLGAGRPARAKDRARLLHV